MAPTFHEITMDLGEDQIFLLKGGDGPPVLLLHGYPQTHRAWHTVAEQLADAFTVILPDLPGYGRSRGPTPDPAHTAYSKRRMAAVLRTLMQRLGFEQFFMAGHDRGGRIGYRLCLDWPETVPRFAAVDIVPTADAWQALDARAALHTHHWTFLAQPSPLPERMIGADPDLYIGYLLDTWAGRPDALRPEDRRAYLDQFHDPAVIAATCADYRAGASTDWALDTEDLAAGRRLRCPTLIIWGTGYLTGVAPSPLSVWERWCDTVTETALPCGHFVPEEEPDACAQALRRFFNEPMPSRQTAGA